MEHLKWIKAQADYVLGALLYVLSMGGKLPIKNIEWKMLKAMRHSVFEHSSDLSLIKSLSPEEIAKLNLDRTQQKRVMEFLVLMPYVAGRVRQEKIAIVEDYARHLEMNTESLKLLRKMGKQHMLTARICLIRKLFPALLKVDVPHQLKTAWEMVEEAKGDEKVLARYQALEDYPQKSLGRAFYDFYHRHQFPLPGQIHCIPSGLVVIHDLAHILGGFEPSYEGEISVSAFQAGYTTHYPWTIAVVGLLDNHCGLTADLPSHLKASKYHLSRQVYAGALRMGMEMNYDLYDNWDYWQHFKRPVEEIRSDYNILGAGDII